MDRLRLHLSWTALCGLTSIALLLATGAATPARAEACWGCIEYACTSGHEMGGYLCEVGDLDCSFVAKVFFGCKSRWCKTKESCRQPVTPTTPVEPKIGPSPDDPAQTMSEGAPASPAIAMTHPAPWQPAVEGAPLP